MQSAPHTLCQENDPWSYIRGLQPGSLCDWPGRVSAVLFMGGCNLRCPTCHNAGLAWNPEQYPRISKSAVSNFIQARSSWLDGLVISGGEPTHVPGLASLVQEISTFGLPIKLDTNGFQPDTVRFVLDHNLIQAVAVDVKGPWSKYPRLTGNRCSPQQAQKALQAIFSLAQCFPESFSFRCTAVPELTLDDLEKTQGLLPAGFSLTIQSYIPSDTQTPKEDAHVYGRG